MAKGGKTQGNAKVSLNDNKGKGTTIGRGLTKTSSMNKSKKRDYKKYRGQG